MILAVLGTHEQPFSRAVRMAAALRRTPDEELHVQSGHTPPLAGVDAHWRQWYSRADLDQAMLDASSVVVHGGSGCIFRALELGLRPIVIPRLARYGEHVDDHQIQLAARLAADGRIVLWMEGEGVGEVRERFVGRPNGNGLAKRPDLRTAVWVAAAELSGAEPARAEPIGPKRAPAGAIDVVIPARDEEADLPSCLLSVLGQVGVEGVNVVVIANGCSDRTAEVANGLRPAAEAGGHRLSVVEIPEPGKARALNAADRLLRGEVHVYLDADVALSKGTLRELYEVLAPPAGARMASPVPMPLLPADRFAAAYAEVWMELPNVADQVVGLGCYAVNRAGRRRWSAMPEIVADDAFVRSRFTDRERVLLRREQMVYAFPSGRDLLGVLTRWRDGNREIARLSPRGDPRSSQRRALASLARRPSAWRHLPAFAAASTAARLQKRSGPWFRSRRRPWAPTLPLDPHVGVGIVADQSAVHLGECLQSLEVALSGVRADVTVVSNDRNACLVASRFPAISLIRNSCDPGYPVAADQSVAGHEGELLLFADPSAIVEPQAVELLVLVAGRFPWAGIYGGQEICPGLPARSVARPQIRRVRALQSGLLLIRADVWSSLGGFGCAGHPEAELCRRARRSGFVPLQVTEARFMRAAPG